MVRDLLLRLLLLLFVLFFLAEEIALCLFQLLPLFALFLLDELGEKLSIDL